MILRTLVAVLLVAAPVSAEVVRIEVKSRTPVLAGQAFGTTGPYERLAGTIYFAIDPRNTANLIIADIDKAPRNAAGKVEFSSDFYLIKPKDPSRGNGTVLYEVSNRGGKGMVGFFNFAAGGVDPQTAEQFGDGFLLETGLHAAVGRLAVRRAAARRAGARVRADRQRGRRPVDHRTGAQRLRAERAARPRRRWPIATTRRMWCPIATTRPPC